MKINKSLLIKTLFLFVILFALAFSVSADLQISTTASDLGDIADSEAKQGSFSVVNSETADLTVNFASSPGFAHLDTTKPKITNVVFSKQSTTLAANDGSETITFTVDVPAKSYAGQYTGNMKASSASPALEVTQEFTFNVPERLDIASGAKVLMENILVGRSSSADFSITNEGNKETTITSVTAPSSLTIGTSSTALDTSGMSFSLSTSALAHQGSVTVTATLTIPEGQTVGTYDGGNLVVNYGADKQEEIPLEIEVREPSKLLTVPSEIKIGGSNQKRDIEAEQTFTITNSGDEKIEGITIASSGVDIDYLAKFKRSQDTDFLETTPAFSLLAGESQSINVKIHVPEDQDSGIKDIGDVVVDSTESEISQITISQFKLETRCMLDISGSITAEFDSPDDDDEEDTFGNGGTVNGVIPGSDLTFSFEVKNDFSDSDDAEEEMEIRSVRAKITLRDIDDGDDESKSTSLGSLDPQDEETAELKFELPREINEKTQGYKIEIEVYGSDKNGARHEINWDATLDIEKHDDFIEITKARFLNPIVEVGDTAKLEFEIQNMGQEKEDEAEVQITCDELGIVKDYTEDDIDKKLCNNMLSKKSKWDEVFEFDIEDSWKPGTYKFEIESYYDNDVPSDNTIIELTIEASETVPQDTTSDQQDQSTDATDTTTSDSQGQASTGGTTIIDQGQGQVVDLTGQANVIIEEEDKFTDSTAYSVLLVVGIILLLAILILLIVKVFI